MEDNLTEKLVLKQVASQAFCSLYHFHRIFQGMCNLTVKEYIRKRRLTRAARELIESDQRILDIALKYQYSSPEAFTRAFKQMYKITPSKFRKKYDKITNGFKRINLISIHHRNIKGGFFMKPKIITKDSFNVLGIEKKIDMDKNFVQVPKFWQNEMEAGICPKLATLPGVVKSGEILGLCSDFDGEKNQFSYIICTRVNTLDEIPDGMVVKEIPTARYAVFTAKGTVPEAVQKVIRYVYQTWFPETNYDRGAGPEFELYDERADGTDSAEVDIYIPIK